MKPCGEFINELRTPQDDDALFEMAHLYPKHTGLPFVVWISVRGGAQQDIRVKVSPGSRAIPSQMVYVAIRPEVEVVQGELDSHELAQLTNWVDLNRDVLVKYWDSEIDTVDTIKALRPIHV